MSFPLNKKQFAGKGRVYDIPMQDMNSMLESTSGATITDGYIDSLSFTISSDDKLSTGNFKMIYHNLRVAAKDVAKNDTSQTALRIKTFIANKFIINKSNPAKLNAAIASSFVCGSIFCKSAAVCLIFLKTAFIISNNNVIRRILRD